MQFRRVFALAMLCTAGVWAAERVTGYRAQLNGPSGTVDGVLLTLGDRLIFVDSEQPDESFAIPRSDVRELRVRDDGTVTARVVEPYTGPYGEASDFRIRLLDPGSANRLVQWAGLPGTRSTPRTDIDEQPGSLAGEQAFEVRHDDDNGRLVVSPEALDFVNLSNRSKSKHWAYGELKGIERKGSDEIVLHPYHRDDYRFKTTRAMDDALYNAIADRIVAARPQR